MQLIRTRVSHTQEHLRTDALSDDDVFGGGLVRGVDDSQIRVLNRETAHKFTLNREGPAFQKRKMAS